MKISIIVDSISGLSILEAHKKQWNFIPLFLRINDNEYADGIDIDNDKFYSQINENTNISTSSSSPKIIQELFKKLSKKSEYIIYIPISKFLSSQYEIASMVAKNYDNIFIIESKLVSIPIVKIAEYIDKNSNKLTINEILQNIEIINENSIGYIIPKTLKWLKKGGRISPSIARISDLMSIIPIIEFNGKMEKYGKSRIPYKALIKMTKKLFMQFHNDYDYFLLEANGMDIINKAMPGIKKILGIEPKIIKFPRALVIHVGIGTTAIYAVPKI